MQKSALRILSCFLAMVVLFLSVLPFQAVGTEYVSKESFWNWVASSSNIAQGILSHIPIGSRDNVCANSDDGYHHSNGFIKDGQDGYFRCVCKDCGQEFRGYASDLAPAYDNYVETLPASGYTSEGSILWSPKHECFYVGTYTSGGLNPYYCPHGSEWNGTLPNFLPTFDCSTLSVSIRPAVGSEQTGFSRAGLFISDTYPIDGYYMGIESPTYSGTALLYGTSSWASVEGKPYAAESSAVFHYAGVAFSKKFSYSVSFGGSPAYVSFQLFSPVYKITPFNPSGISDIYNTTTRPTSITGGNYGIVGDNGQINKVEDNSTIVNETNNTFYNPATGTTVPIVNWSYDYSDRSYKVTLESGDTVTVTYGDENITIQETTITEGDTITNNYTIYYLVDGSGSVTPPCDHAWTETNTTPATCTVPGSKLSTCSKCQQTKKDPIPALGHDWQVKQTVTTEYDDTGQLIQQGYTIFECSRCHEQYKSSDGTIPPGGGSGTDPGGDEGETIWDKLGNLIGAIGSGVIGLIEAALGKVLDALIALVEGMMERLKTVVEAVLSIFDELPKLFGGFLDFLVAVFPFLPPELMTILTFGILAVVFIGIIKAVRR